MEIILSNSSGQPFYQQIVDQVKKLIQTGQLQEGEALPSMRQLAKELRVSVITTKRAYEELEQAGYLVTVAGKGSFAARPAQEEIRREQDARVEEHLRPPPPRRCPSPWRSFRKGWRPITRRKTKWNTIIIIYYM